MQCNVGVWDVEDPWVVGLGEDDTPTHHKDLQCEDHGTVAMVRERECVCVCERERERASRNETGEQLVGTRACTHNTQVRMHAEIKPTPNVRDPTASSKEPTPFFCVCLKTNEAHRTSITDRSTSTRVSKVFSPFKIGKVACE